MEHLTTAIDEKYITEDELKAGKKNVSWCLNLLMAISLILISPKNK
jgi:hypothetical protein